MKKICNIGNRIFTIFKKIKIENNGCWTWLGCTDIYGYGFIKLNKKTFRLNRVLFELWYGEFDTTRTLKHNCSNEQCCNPEHLFIDKLKNKIVLYNI